MARVVVSDEYSHLFGKEVAHTVHEALWLEILDVLGAIDFERTYKTREKRRAGTLVYSGDTFNKQAKNLLKQRGWKPRRIVYPGQSDYSFEVGFIKGRVGLGIQFGKYFAVQQDLYNLLYLFAHNEIDVGVIVIPSDRLQPEMVS